MPGWALSTPASQDPSVDTTRPFSYSAVCSPTYQMFPWESWAYQSMVSSTTAPALVTRSCTTRASMPQATLCVPSCTVTSTFRTSPLPSVSEEIQRSPAFIGQYLFVMSTLKSAGSSVTDSLPRGKGDGDAEFPESRVPPPPQAPSSRTPIVARERRPNASGALTSASRVGLAADNSKVLVELHVDLGAVVPGDLDLVIAVLVVHLGPADPPAAGLCERGVARLLQRRTADRDVWTFGGVRPPGRARDAAPTGDDRRRSGDDVTLFVDPHEIPPRWFRMSCRARS